MQNWRRRGIGTPAGWYTLLGLALLGASLWVPFGTARRTARLEQRADEIAALLLAATATIPGPLDDADVPHVLACFFALALRDEVHIGDLERVDPPLPGTLLTLQNKHYAFHLAVSPPAANATVGRGTEPAYEAMAWPLEAIGPGHSAFFHADDAQRAYTRNLGAGNRAPLQGLGGERPTPGHSHRRPTTAIDTRWFYRSFDDERWIHF